MSPRLVTEIFPYERQQTIEVYRDEQPVEVHILLTESLAKDLAQLYLKENACQLTLLGSHRYNTGLKKTLQEIESSINVVVL